MDPILRTKKERFFATPTPAIPTGNFEYLLFLSRANAIAVLPGETEVGSAGEQPAKG
jgi:hypothetical protein